MRCAVVWLSRTGHSCIVVQRHTSNNLLHIRRIVQVYVDVPNLLDSIRPRTLSILPSKTNMAVVAHAYAAPFPVNICHALALD